MLACSLALLPRRGHADLQRRLGRALGASLALATLAAFGILLSRTLELNGGAWPTLLPDMRLAITATHFGQVWLWRLPALAVLWLGFGWRTRRRHAPVAGWLMVPAAAVIALTRSQTGHPAGHGDFTLAVWIDWAHVLAAGAWVGSLFGMSLVVFPHLLRAGGAALAASAEIFQRLSTVSGAALVVLLGAGACNAVTQLGSVAALWSTRYGVILDIKLAIVLMMVAIGAHNRYVKLPRLLGAARRAAAPVSATRGGAPAPHAIDTESGIVRACARAVLAESLLGLAVIGVTAVLLHAVPPAGAPHGAHAAGSELQPRFASPGGRTPGSNAASRPSSGKNAHT